MADENKPPETIEEESKPEENIAPAETEGEVTGEQAGVDPVVEQTPEEQALVDQPASDQLTEGQLPTDGEGEELGKSSDVAEPGIETAAEQDAETAAEPVSETIAKPAAEQATEGDNVAGAEENTDTGEQIAEAGEVTDSEQKSAGPGEDTAQAETIPLEGGGNADNPGESGEAASPAVGNDQEFGDQEGEQPLPNSDTFDEGTRAESPVAVGENLSRDGTPTQNQRDDRAASPPVPGTPDKDGSIIRGDIEEGEEEEEEEDEDEDDDYDDEPQYDREQLIARYHQALTERHQLQDQNYQLQHKLAEHFRKKKADERQDVDKNVTDQEQRYLKYMANLDELRRQDAEERDMFKQQIEDMEMRCEEKKQHVNDERLKFMEFKKQIALNAVNSRSGKPIPPRDVEQYLLNESRKEEEVVKVRLENIKLKNKLRKKEQQLKSKEELAEGLHMIDFEQLKIENQTYNEKIEERNEELLKLRKKITSTVQVLTHLKEKLQFVQGENGQLNVKLKDVEEHAAKKRDILSRTKQARDALRIDNQRLRQNCGLLGNEPLLRDFEERKDESDDLKIKLDQLKMQHAELTLNLNGVRRKIDQAKQGRM